MGLTKSQQAAIRHAAGNLQLIACAGSGKTEVVARRIVRLLREGDPDGPLLPANIVAFTFTDKAAAELKQRIVTRCRQELGDVHGLADMFVGTIHAFCLDLLKTEVPEYLRFEILNDVQTALFADRYSSRTGLTNSTDLRGRPLKRYRDTQVYLSALSVLREADLHEDELADCSVADGLVDYGEELHNRSYFDYSSILETAVDVMTNEMDVRERLRQRVRHIVVDEYQDVNPVQEAIVWLLHDLGARVCVVGDDDQTIYQWRGSHVRSILSFKERYPDVEQVWLEENFRSSRGIVETARDFIARSSERLEKAMKPTDAQSFERGDIVALGFDTPDEEAAYIAATAASLRGVTIASMVI